MSDFKVHILGCGSALPTTKHLPTSQVVSLHGRSYMIDCGEGAQRQFRAHKLSFSSLVAIFISHLHGDHCFGLPGLLSSLSLLGRTAPLYVIGPRGLAQFLEPILAQFCSRSGYETIVQERDYREHQLVWEDKGIRVHSFPLAHRTPTMGYMIEEQPRMGSIDKEYAAFWQVPRSWHVRLLSGEDFYTPDGTRVPNARLVRRPRAPRSYAYCSDTAFSPGIIPYIKGVDLLYHEATFLSCDEARAHATGHSTATQAARIAHLAEVGKLLIGHYSARYPAERLLAEAQEIFTHTMAAQEGMCVEIG